jgi:hypothetical protein
MVKKSLICFRLKIFILLSRKMFFSMQTFKNSILNLNRSILSLNSKILHYNYYGFKQQNYFLSTNNKSLQDYLISKIKSKGPITIAEYMREALSNPIYVSKKLSKLCSFLIYI